MQSIELGPTDSPYIELSSDKHHDSGLADLCAHYIQMPEAERHKVASASFTIYGSDKSTIIERISRTLWCDATTSEQHMPRFFIATDMMKMYLSLLEEDVSGHDSEWLK